MLKNRQFVKLDAQESIFFARELESIKARSYDVMYPELKARSVIPVSFDAGPGAESITYEQYDQVGMAKVIANYADDLPRADVKGKEFTAKVKSLGASYGYNLQEIRAAQMAGKPLTQRRADAAKRGILQKENSIAFSGDALTGLQGWFSNPNVPDVAALFGLWTAPARTADEILADMNAVVTSVHTASLGLESPDTLLLPLSRYNLIWTKRIPDTNISVMRFFLDNSPHIKQIDWLNELETAGVGSTPMMIAYRRDPSKFTLEIPQDFEQLPVQEEQLEFVVPCHSRLGGVIIYYPLSMAKMDGL